MKLVLVESPTKSDTLQRFLGKEYKVMASFGHIRDLPKGSLGIDIENNFEPKYVIPAKSRKTVTALKKETTKAEGVILATDEDREGEAIAWHLVQALGLGNSKSEARNPKLVERIVFHEITKRAIDEALKNPRGIDMNRVYSQQGRRILDRIVGYKLSPFLWKKIARGLSAGRVQSVALRLIVDREQEIRNFKPQEYWTIIASLLKQKNTYAGSIEANLVKINSKTLDKFAIPSKEEAQKLVDELKKCAYTISKIEKKETKKNPPPPFITSTLQQESARRLRFTAKKTMFLAQRLYEEGHITYMRTDSVNLSSESEEAAKNWLLKNLGSNYALTAPRKFKSKSKLAQEAHEAIRPTNIENAPKEINLGEQDEKKLYELIWQSFMASQMPEAKFDATSVEIKAENSSPKADPPREGRSYGFRTTGNIMKFDGFLKIWPQKFEQKELPELKENEKLTLEKLKPEQHFTEPPPRYTESSLVKTLEEYDIGRPSTYAPIISVIQTRNYVEKESGKFKPTEMGELVNKVLTENFPEIVDIGFTAQMEDELDEISTGKISWQGVINDFYRPFSKNLEAKYEQVSRKELTEERTDERCELCGRPMIIKMGRFGKFMACSGFPECKNTKNLADAKNAKSNANDENKNKMIGMNCPKCGEGDVVERRVNKGRARGRRFWGCSRYPSCDYATWENPKK